MPGVLGGAPKGVLGGVAERVVGGVLEGVLKGVLEGVPVGVPVGVLDGVAAVFGSVVVCPLGGVFLSAIIWACRAAVDLVSRSFMNVASCC